MNKKEQILNKLVKEEAKNLKKNATKAEKSNLNFNDLDDTDYNNCIYGQLTGNCTNYRANTLIYNCATRVFNTGEDRSDTINSSTLNGKPKKIGNEEDDRTEQYFSPIEVFIHKPENKKNGNNKILIDYLKGDRKTLRFK